MKNSIREELTSYILERQEEAKKYDSVLTHFNLFNEDYYMIGYWNASEWLKKHDLDVFEAIDEVKEYQNDIMGEFNPDSIENAEILVNNLVYQYGEEICNEMEIEI